MAFRESGDLHGHGSYFGSYAFRWKLRDFSLIDSSPGHPFMSRAFPHKERDCNLSMNWCLTIMPVGERDADQNYVSCFMTCPNLPKNSINMKFSMYLRNYENKTICSHDEDWFVPVAGTRYGRAKMCVRESLLEQLPDDVLTVAIEISFALTLIAKPDSHEEYAEMNPSATITCDFSRLLDTHMCSDVKLIFSGAEVPAHKAILSSRSPIFENMFTHDTQENKSGCVKIPDVRLELGKSLLQYVYTGHVSELTNDMAMELLQMSDKYEMEDLKLYCSNFLIANLNENNVAKVLYNADLYNAQKLRSKAIDYFCHNKSAFDFETHQELLEQRPRILTDILRRVPPHRLS